VMWQDISGRPWLNVVSYVWPEMAQRVYDSPAF
jgi:hypothetical protein